MTALPDHPEHIGSSSLGTDKGAASPVKSAGFRKKFASYMAEKQEISANICFMNKEPLTTGQKNKD